MKPEFKTVSGKNSNNHRKQLPKGDKTEPSQKFQRGKAVEIFITSLDDEGTGVAIDEDKCIHVAGTLPQERCLARVRHTGTKSVFADLIKIIEPSALRLNRCPCNDAAVCLGCPLIAMRYGEQLRWKQEQVQRELNEYSSLQGIVVPRLLTPERNLHYRTTAKLAVAGTYAEPYIGIYRRASHDVVDLEDCKVHHPLINSVIKTVSTGINKLRVPVYQASNKSGVLRYLVVRVSEYSNEIMVTFVTARRAFNEIHHLAKYLQEKIPQVKVVCQNVNSSDGNIIFGSSDHFITKQQAISEQVGQVRLRVSPRSFFQAQNDGARLLYETARDWLELNSNQNILDLYCGIGGIGLTLAPFAANVLGIELNSDAVSDARLNARLNGLKNCSFASGDVLELLDDLMEENRYFNSIVLNPPRKGCEKDVLEKIAVMRPERIVYISCSPKTLARDLDILTAKGYSCIKLQPVEMFPQTQHIENVAMLTFNSVVSG